MARSFSADDRAMLPLFLLLLLFAPAYVWVSGFGATSSAPATSLSLASQGPFAEGVKPYFVAAASPGLLYDDVVVTVDGATWPLAAEPSCTPGAGTFVACRGSALVTGADVVLAGDVWRLGGVSSGQTLRILDAEANSVILVLVIG